MTTTPSEAQPPGTRTRKWSSLRMPSASLLSLWTSSASLDASPVELPRQTERRHPRGGVTSARNPLGTSPRSSRCPDPIQIKAILLSSQTSHPVSPGRDLKEIKTRVIPHPSGWSNSIPSMAKLPPDNTERSL
jgi:hypothetical protein